MAEKITVQYVRELGETLHERINQCALLASFQTESARESAGVYAAVVIETFYKLTVWHVHTPKICATLTDCEHGKTTVLHLDSVEFCDIYGEPPFVV